MRLLLDTHLLVWVSSDSRRLSSDARAFLGDSANTLLFSVASLWEIAIKAGRGRADFVASPRAMRPEFLDRGYEELAVSGEHVLAVVDLPPIHRDPFDRLLIAQATVEEIMLVTSDATVARYPGPIRKV